MDLERWAAVVCRMLKKDGVFYMLEGHPLNMLWEREISGLRLQDDDVGYFDTVPREHPGFPADAVARRQTEGKRPAMKERHWRPGQVMNALVKAGLNLEHFDEHPDLFWDQFPQWPEKLRGRLPHSFSVLFRR